MPLIIVGAILGAIVLVFAFWLFLVGTERKGNWNLDKNAKFAHRGLHNTAYYKEKGEKYIPENSLAAFALAVERGIGIELDLRASSDGVLFVFHDASLLRMTGVNGNISDFSAADISGLRLLNSEEGIPTFSAVLDLVSGRVPLLIEIKEEGRDHTVSETLAASLAEYEGEYLIQSFSPLALAVIKRRLPSAKRGLLYCEFTRDKNMRSMKYRLLSGMLLNFLARPHFISYDKACSRCFPLGVVLRIFSPKRFVYTVIDGGELEELRFFAEHIIFEGCGDL